MADAEQEIGPPSRLFEDCRERLRATSALGPLLDLACGRGRHSLAAAELGLEVVSVDRNHEALTALARLPRKAGRIEVVEADLEGPSPPHLERAPFGAILVFRYLHRPLAPWIESLLAPGGLLLYETFTTAQRTLGWGPSRDAFLLEPGELPGLFPGLVVESYEEGASEDPRPAQTARLVASRPR